jgi:hypothetical protein
MLGAVMYWTAIVVQPTIQILEQQNVMMETGANQTNHTITIAKWILGNITNIDITENVTAIQKQLDIMQAQLDILVENKTS